MTLLGTLKLEDWSKLDIPLFGTLKLEPWPLLGTPLPGIRPPWPGLGCGWDPAKLMQIRTEINEKNGVRVVKSYVLHVS